MIEVELKFEISTKSIKKFLKLLKKRGFVTSSPRTYEKTTMYDNKTQIMQKTNGRLRLRVSGYQYEVSYKKPLKNNSKIKKEIEYEVSITNISTFEKILKAMGFRPTTSYERFRTVFVNPHWPNTKVMLDEYPFSSFLEIEGGEAEIKKVAGKLVLSLKNNLVDPCDTLFQKWRQKRGLSFKPHMLFKDYNQ